MAEFVCGVREKNPYYLSACRKLSEYPDTGYCVLHFPGEKKKEDFEQVKKDKLEQEDYDFSGTVFPEGTSDFVGVKFHTDTHFIDATFIGGALFAGATFSGETTSFVRAQFSSEWTSFEGAHFSGTLTYFDEAQFSGEDTYFDGAQFSSDRTYFRRAQFLSGKRISFKDAQFSGDRTSFDEAQFGSAETSFQEATFAKEVYFSGVTFSEKVTFWGTQGNPVFGPGAWAMFDRPRIEKPEQFTFNTVLLHPGWFINVDVRKVDFTDVKWYGMPGGPEGTLDEEIHALENRGVESPHTLLAQACQRLAANAEENRDYRLANDFYYWAMDALRKAGWRRLGLIRTMYWALSGYGVRAARAFFVLMGICAAFAVLYMLLGPDALRVSSASSFGQALEHGGQAVVYSLSTTARLNPEPKPDPGLFQFLVTIESILGPLQIALLALAIRRKVMR